MNKLRSAVVTLGVAAVVVGGSGALADSPPEIITPVFASWFQPDPTCDLLGACLATTDVPGVPPVTLPIPIPNSPYPDGTLHVAWAGATETARSYLTFDVFSVSGDLETAVLDVPLDLTPTNGNALPELSTVVVCTTTDVLESSTGSFVTPPTVDCSDGVLLTYVDEPTPRLTGDLGPLIDELQAATAIALLPDAEASGADAWHVTFSSHLREGSDVPAPTLTVTTSEPETGAAPRPDVPAPPPAGEPSQAVDDFALETSTPDLGPIDGITEPVTVDDAISLPEVAAPSEVSDDVPDPVALPVVFDDTRGSYPQLYLLPLVLLLVVPFLGRSLTADLRAGT